MPNIITSAAALPPDGKKVLTADGGYIDSGRPSQQSKIFSTSDGNTTPTTMQLIPFSIAYGAKITRLSGSVGTTQATKLMEFAILDSGGVKLSSSGPVEIPEAGAFSVALPEVNLPVGKYYVAFAHNATTATFASLTTAKCFTTTAAFPIPSTVSGALTAGTGAISVALHSYRDEIVYGYSRQDLGAVRVLGINTGLAQPWGVNMTTGKLCVSANSGASFTDMMPIPGDEILQGGGLRDLLISGTNIYLLISNGRIAKSSDLTESATWADISCPVSEELFRSTATVRPYGFAVFEGYIFLGEYSSGDLTGGPRILKMEIATGTWSVSKQFANARHIHSFYSVGTSALYVSLGDAGYGDDIGIHQLVPAGFGSPDTWVKWTSIATPRTSYYPIDFIVTSGSSTLGVPAGIYCASDRVGVHVMHSKTTGTPGSFNLASAIWQKSGYPNTETVGSLSYIATTGMLLWWTQETTRQAIYCAIPPYSDSIVLEDLSALPQLFLGRAVVSGSYLLMWTHRIKIPQVLSCVPFGS